MPEIKPMYSRLTPVLPVRDVIAEREFYYKLRFCAYEDPDEQYPDTDFAAFEFGQSIRFGVAVEPGFDMATAESRLWWQFEVPDLDAVYECAEAAGLEVLQPPRLEAWGRRTLKLRSPNGYLVSFEEGG
jgi:hypothetical protein